MSLSSLYFLLSMMAASAPEVHHVPLPARETLMLAAARGIVAGAGDAGVWLYDEASARVRSIAAPIVNGLAVDDDAVYWSVSDAPPNHRDWIGVWRAGKEGGAPERVTVSPAPGALAVTAAQIVWLDGGPTLKDDGAVLVADKGGSHAVGALARAQSDPWSVVVIDGVVYWSTCGSSMSRPLGPKDGALWSVSLDGKHSQRLLSGLRCPVLAGKDDDSLVFLDEGRVQSVVAGHHARTLWRAAGRHAIGWIRAGEDSLVLVGDDARGEGARSSPTSGALIRLHRGAATTLVGALSGARGLVTDGAHVHWVDDQGLATMAIPHGPL